MTLDFILQFDGSSRLLGSLLIRVPNRLVTTVITEYLPYFTVESLTLPLFSKDRELQGTPFTIIQLIKTKPIILKENIMIIS